MKNIFLIVLTSLAMIFHASAQDVPEVLIGDNIRNISGFGGFTMEFSSIDQDLAVSTGGGGAVLLNQVFYFGGYGMNNHSETAYEIVTGLPGMANLDFHHGGIWTGYIFKPNKLIHCNISTKFGWGMVRLNDRGISSETLLNDNVFTATPQIEGEINITYWLRISASAGYRLTDGLNNAYYSDGDFSSPVFGISFLFGWFKPFDIGKWGF